MPKLKILFIGLLIVFFLVKIYPFRQKLFGTFNYKDLENSYNHSQFAPNPSDAVSVIDDDQLYQYAGYIYVTQGVIDSVNVEHPPLVKYLYGLGLILFGNAVLIQLIFAIGFLIVSYLLADKILKNTYLALLIPFFLINESLFINQATTTLLDLFQTMCVLLFMFVYLISPDNNPRLYVLLGIILSLIAASKFPALAVIVLLSLFIFELAWKKFNLKNFAILAVVALLLYLTTYSPLLITQGFSGFIRVQLQAAHIHASHVPNYPFLAPIRVFFLNQWPVWFDSQNPIHQTAFWSFLWPILGLTIFASPMLFLTKKIEQSFIIIFTWLYFIFINSRLFFPHYLLPLLPITYILFILEIRSLIKKISPNRLLSKL
ncbi:hypothetical protein GYA49_03450 [Candidatus Beckwithbacteria bacterium]|nr:hypothetical protein [Candidatus Beckwithbacteria bacterium]